MKHIALYLTLLICSLACIEAEQVTLYSDMNVYKAWQVDEEVIRATCKYHPLVDPAPPVSISSIAKIAMAHLKKTRKSEVYVVWSISLEPIEGLYVAEDKQKQPVYWCYNVQVRNQDGQKQLDELQTSKDIVVVLLDGTVVPMKKEKHK